MSTRMLGHHELLIRLASGGAANVFLVRDTQSPPPNRLLALKILLPSLAANEDFLNMFFTEAKIAARLQHPNVVTIAGFGQVEGIHCLAMEYVFGASLSQVLRASARAKKPLTVGVLLRITAAVCDALHYAHELKDEHNKPMGLVHRDVTPQNILIGFNGVPKLTDFGIAKATNRGWETQAGIVKGKFSYMSPEQALGKKVDRRSDIFCTGIVLWEALTGRDLFRGSTPLEVLTNIREQKIDPPSKVVPGLTPIVDPIVMKALRRSPKARYQSAAEMKKDIEDLIVRAGVTIDANVISREFAAIYGDEIVNRAFALRQAMAGKADIDQLAEVLGGSKLNPKHLPVIPGGITNPDPLGLFSSEPSAAAREEQARPAPVLPARIEQPFTLASAPVPSPASPSMRPTESFDDLEIVENEEPEIEVAEDAHVEPDVPEVPAAKQRWVEPPKQARPQGWDDSTAMSVPSDELLSMISEDDATIGYLPAAFAARFGQQLKQALEGIDDGELAPSFDDELTVGMSSAPELAKLRALKPLPTNVHEESTPWRDPVSPGIPMRRFEVAKIAQAPTEANPNKGRLFRPPPRAPSLDLDATEDRVASRPIPRAPSLDMDSDPDVESTPVPQLEEPELPSAARSSRPSPASPPPPPPRGASRSFIRIEESLPEAELDLAVPILEPLQPPSASEPEPGSMPGSAVLDSLTPEESAPETTFPGQVVPQDYSPEGSDSQLTPALEGVVPARGASAILFDAPVEEELPPLSPNALRALATTSAPIDASPASSVDALVSPVPSFVGQMPPLADPPKRGLQLGVGILALIGVGLIALGVVIGILLTRT
ncbi:protein kinase [Myxococcota bacterium]|nr:protein kinase [Myxococcota bacterium]